MCGPVDGVRMPDLRPEPTLQLVRALVELLTPYEEELINTEATCPNVAYLRRAVSMVIAEGCYWISDEGNTQCRPTPPAG